MDELLLTFLRESLGLAEESTEEQITAALQEKLPELIAAQETLASVQTELDGMKEQYPEGTEVLTDEQKETLSKFESVNAIATSAVEATRKECTRLYKIVCGSEVDDSILSMINGAEWDTLVALNKQYKLQSEEKYEATCQDCGSKNVSRVSAQTGDSGVVPPAGGADSDNPPVEKDNSEISLEFKKVATRTAGIHGQSK
jgi:hypothetical protein